MPKAVKTSISFRPSTLARIKAEARRQHRSLSGLVNVWSEDALLQLAAERRASKDGQQQEN